MVARQGGELVGTCAIGFKRVALLGRTHLAALLFDWRVAPSARGGGTALRLLRHAGQQAIDEADFIYSWVVDENVASHGLGRFVGARNVGRFRLLVYPTHRELRCDCSVDRVSRAMVVAKLVNANFDFAPADYPEAGLVGAYIAEDHTGSAGCSVWTMQDVLGEVVQGLPAHLTALSRLQRHWPVSRLPLPRIPRAGERVHSWYVCDLFASTPNLARQLIRHVASQGKADGVDFCNVVLGDQDTWLDAVAADHCRLFCPTLNYRLVARWKAPSQAAMLRRVWIDARDI